MCQHLVPLRRHDVFEPGVLTVPEPNALGFERRDDSSVDVVSCLVTFLRVFAQRFADREIPVRRVRLDSEGAGYTPTA